MGKLGPPLKSVCQNIISYSDALQKHWCFGSIRMFLGSSNKKMTFNDSVYRNFYEFDDVLKRI